MNRDERFSIFSVRVRSDARRGESVRGYCRNSTSTLPGQLLWARLDLAAQCTKMKFRFPVASRYGRGAGGCSGSAVVKWLDGFSFAKNFTKSTRLFQPPQFFAVGVEFFTSRQKCTSPGCLDFVKKSPARAIVLQSAFAMWQNPDSAHDSKKQRQAFARTGHYGRLPVPNSPGDLALLGFAWFARYYDSLPGNG